MHGTRLARSALAIVLLAACGDARDPVTIGPPEAPSLSLSDGARGGNDHFYFLPPAVPEPAFTGTFDASLDPVVEICESDGAACVAAPFATYTSESGPGSERVRVVPEDEHYIVNWHTDAFDLDTDAIYRLTVRVAGTELGHLDVGLGTTGGELKAVDDDHFIALKDGRTLPLRFRIEEGAVFVLGPDGGTVVARGGRVRLEVPPDALTEVIGLTIQPGGAVDEEVGAIAGTIWSFLDGVRFAEPATLTLRFDPEAVPADLAAPEAALVQATEAGGLWHESPSTVDLEAGTVQGPVFGFSRIAIVQKTQTLDVSPAELRLRPGADATLVAVARASSGTALGQRALRWGTPAPGIVDPGEDGAIHAVAPGGTRVNVTPALPPRFPADVDPCALPYVICTWPAAEVPVEVLAPVASVTIVSPASELQVGAQLQLEAVPRDEAGNVLRDRDVTWASGDDAVAVVDGSGLVEGVASGTATITATSEGVSGELLLDVVPAGPVFPPADNVVVPPGFAADLFAFLDVRVRAIALGPPGGSFAGDLFGSTLGEDAFVEDRILRIDPEGVASEFAVLLPEADPVSLEFPDPAGAYGDFLYVTSNNRDGGAPGDQGGTIQRIAPSAVVTDFTGVGLPEDGPGEPNGIRFDEGGAFGGRLFVTNSTDHPGDILAVNSSGGITTFLDDGSFDGTGATGIRSTTIDLGPGGERIPGESFGSDLYFADANCDCIRVVTPDGSLAGVLATVPGALGAIRFPPRSGPFAGYLYASVATADGAKIYRVSPAGELEIFAEHIGSGGDGFEFTPDGRALYVAAGRRLIRIRPQ